jgi:multidrug resistance protein, MATE family
MVPLGISSAAAVSVGRAVGAGDPAGARAAGWTAVIVGALFSSCAALCFLSFAGQIAGFYTHDPETIRVAVSLLGIAAAYQIFDSIQIISTGALRGLGNTRTAMVWNLLGYWIIGLPLGCWLCFVCGWGIVGLWDGLCAAILLAACGLGIELKTTAGYLT